MTLETRAVVTRIEGGQTFVESVQSGGCGQCSGKGCGSAHLTKMLCSESRQFRVDNRIGAETGEQVVVAVDDGVVLRSVGLVYLLPLALAFAGAVAAGGAALTEAQRDGYAAAGAVCGLVVGFVCSRWLAGRRPDSRGRASIVRRWHGD